MRFPGFEGEWVDRKIRDVAIISSGSTPLRSNSMFFDGGNIHWVKTTDLNNSLIYDTEEKITEYAKTRINPIGSVLVAMYGGFNQIGRTGYLKVPAATNQALSVLNTDGKEVISAYLLHFLNAKVNLWREFAGSSRKDPNITGSDVGRFPISFPSVEEQHKIASLLFAIDERIATQNKIIEGLKLLKSKISKLVFSQHFRFTDETKSYPIWETKRLEELCEIIGGGTPSTGCEEYWNGNIQWFTPTEIKTNFVYQSQRTITPLGLQNSSAKILPIGTILLTTRATIGEVAISGVECATNQGFQSLLAKPNTNNVFLFYWLRENKHKLKRLAKGSTFPEISKSDLSNIAVIVPCKSEQDKIARSLATIDKKIDAEGHLLSLWHVQKKFLLANLFI